MRKEQTFCDICEEEKPVEKMTIQVIFVTEQTEGRSCTPHLTNESMDICTDCLDHVLEGNYLYGAGAQGHNKFYFKKD